VNFLHIRDRTREWPKERHPPNVEWYNDDGCSGCENDANVLAALYVVAGLEWLWSLNTEFRIPVVVKLRKTGLYRIDSVDEDDYTAWSPTLFDAVCDRIIAARLVGAT